MKNKIDLESLYLKMPVAIQNALVSIEGWRIQKRRYDGEFFSLFKEKNTWEQGENKFYQLKHQKKRLKKFLTQAQKSKFWTKRYFEFGIDLSADDIISELSKLPVLTKPEVKENYSDIDLSSKGEWDTINCHTSGTTGSGLIFPVAKSAECAQWATWWRYRFWHGIGFDTWCGYFGGRSLVSLGEKRPPFWRINRPGHQIMFSAYHLSEQTASHYIEAINRYKVPWLHGYPSTLAYLAGLKKDLALPDTPSVRVVTVGAESLLFHQKKMIESTFDVPVREHYGMAEGVANISECPEGCLHVDEDFSYVEFLKIPQTKNLYKIVGTNWTNPAFPLIRYDTGDIATIENKTCSCGRMGRVVSNIDGRKEDFVVLPSGAKVGRLDHIFKDMIKINAAQIFQPEEGMINLRIVPGKDYSITKDEVALLSETRKRLGDEIKIIVEYMQELPHTQSGKLRFVVSDLIENKVA